MIRVFVSVVSLLLSPLMFLVELVTCAPRKKFKRVLITGGNSGLGESIAVEMAGPGVTLVLIARDKLKLAKVKKGL